MHRSVLAVALVLLLAGCGKSVGPAKTSSSSGGAGSSGAAATGVPKAKGDVANVSWNLQFGEPTSLDWIHAFDYSENTVVANMCENLLRLTPDFKIVPSLAASYKAEPATAPTKYVLQIRPNVKFWDGHTMTADDVVYSLHRHLDPKQGSYWTDTYQYVKSVAKTGPMQVTITMKRPDALFLEYLALPSGGVGEASYIKAKGSSYGTPSGGVMCTGPFKFDRWNKGDSIVLQRNPSYWDASLRPKVGTLTFRFLSDDATATSALVSGQIDGSYDVPLSGLQQLRSASDGKFYSGAGFQTLDIAIASLKGGLKDVRIRRALLDAIDYAGIDKTILQGTGQPIKTLVTPATYGYGKSIFEAAAAKIPDPKQDLAAARKLVQQAGGPPKQPIVIAYRPSNQTYTQMLGAVQDSARKVGITIKLHAVPDSSYANLFDDPKARAGLDGLVTLNYTDIPDPLEFYTQIVMPGVPENFDNYDNPQVVKLIEQARAAGDPDTRARLTAQAQAIITRDVVWFPIAGVQTRLFMNNKITGAPSSFVYLYYPWAADLGAA
jgi:peptide/nickel transport system substrate-binding protein